MYGCMYVHYFEIPRLPSLFDGGNNDTEWDVLGKMIWFSYAIKMYVFQFSGGVARMILDSFFVTFLQFILNDFSTNDFPLVRNHLKIKCEERVRNEI